MLEEIKQTTKDLVKIPSDKNNPEAIKKTVEYVKNFFKDSSLIIEEYEREEKPSLVIKNFEGNEADISLCGHLDVVPANTEDQRTPYEKDGKMYGRGAADMKIGDSIIMHLMKNLENEGYREKKLMLIFTTDEEIGGFRGVNKLVNEKGISSKIVLIPDGGRKEKIVYTSKGVLGLEVEVKGETTHSSRRRTGDSAIDKMIGFYKELREKIENQEMLTEENEYRSTTVNLTNIQAGEGSINVIPEKAEGKIDVRFTQERTADKLLEYIQSIAEKFGGIYIHPRTKGVMLYTPSDNKYLQKYWEIAKEQIGDNVILSKQHGATDGRYFSEKGNIVIAHQPEIHNIHGQGEYSEIDSYLPIYKTYEKFIKETSV